MKFYRFYFVQRVVGCSVYCIRGRFDGVSFNYITIFHFIEEIRRKRVSLGNAFDDVVDASRTYEGKTSVINNRWFYFDLFILYP